MNRIAVVIALCVGFGCTEHTSTTNEPVVTGDSCAVLTTADSCRGDADCAWYGTGCACPPNDPSCTCLPGACGSIHGNSGSGSGSTGAACACPNGGVCFEQLDGSPVACAAPAPGGGDPCARIQGEGTCQDSTAVTGLCVCGG